MKKELQKNINKLTVVVSVYNEEEILDLFWTELEKYVSAIDFDYEVIFVNDGSTDGSEEILRNLAKTTPKIKILNLSTNFGHEAAMLAGMEYSSGDAVIWGWPAGLRSLAFP